MNMVNWQKTAVGLLNGVFRASSNLVADLSDERISAIAEYAANHEIDPLTLKIAAGAGPDLKIVGDSADKIRWGEGPVVTPEMAAQIEDYAGKPRPYQLKQYGDEPELRL